LATSSTACSAASSTAACTCTLGGPLPLGEVEKVEPVSVVFQ
jgi:hypothetical protein